MQIKAVCDLLYTSEGQKDNGSPILLEHIINDVQCDLMETFSVKYYQDSQRLMRKSRNFAVEKTLTDDLMIDGNRYELMYVFFEGCKYKVQNVLNHRRSILLKILDCEEITK